MESSPREQIAANLRAARARSKITQAELAKRAGLSEITIFRFENEERSPNVEHLLAIAQALNIAATELLPDLANPDRVIA